MCAVGCGQLVPRSSVAVLRFITGVFALGLGCKNATSSTSVETCPPGVYCPYVYPLGLQPSSAMMKIGDTLTMQWDLVDPQYLNPKDTLAANRRWRFDGGGDSGAVVLDSVTGHVKALQPGWAQVVLTSEALAWPAFLYVLEPPGADSIITVVQNAMSADSGTVILRGPGRTVLRSQTFRAGQATCWVTPISDSLFYTAIAYDPLADTVALSGWWTQVNLQYDHAFAVSVYDSQYGRRGELGDVEQVDPDPGHC